MNYKDLSQTLSLEEINQARRVLTEIIENQPLSIDYLTGFSDGLGIAVQPLVQENNKTIVARMIIAILCVVNEKIEEIN